MKKILMTLLFMFCFAGATLPAVTAYAEERVTVATPTKPTATNVVQGIRVKWTAVEGVSKYGVWRSETGKNGTYKWLGNPGQNSYLDEAVTSGKTYFYKVTCMVPGTNTHGAKSEAGGVVYVDTPDFTQRYNKAAGIVLEWNKIDGATGYGIYRKYYAGTDEWVRIATVSGNNTFKYTDTTVQNANGSVYRYTVRALADANMKTLSGCRATGRTMVRLTSRTLNSATATACDSVKCAWTTTTQATGYEVRFMEGSAVFKTFTVGNYKTGVKTFTGLTPDTTYRVQVRSYKKVDGVGSFYSAWSEAKTVTTPVDETPFGVIVQEIAEASDGVEFISCGGDVILTRKDDKYGAIKKSGEAIVENKYESWWVMNEEGMTAFQLEDTVYCYDAEGNMIHAIERPVSVKINEGYITYICTKEIEEIGAYWESKYEQKFLMVYDIANKELYMPDMYYDDACGAGEVSPVVDGKFYVSFHYAIECYIYEIDIATLEAKELYGGYRDVFTASLDEYGTFYTYGFYRAAGVISKNGEERFSVLLNQLSDYAVKEIDKTNAQYEIPFFVYKGQDVFNIGKKMILKLLEENTGNSIYFLLDFTDADVEMVLVSEYLSEIEIVTNISDIVKAQYDYISLSSTGNYLACDGDDWFYINDKGEKIADYVDCSDFVGNYALVIEEDGLAYVVDTAFNKVSEGYPADSVYSLRGALCVNKDGKSTLLYVRE